jgi:hypothetical protein
MELLLYPGLILGAIAVPVVLLRIVQDTTVGVYIFVALSSITMMPQLPVVGDRIAIADFVMGLTILVATLKGQILRPAPKGMQLIDQLAMAFTALCTVSSLLAVLGGAQSARVILFMIIYIYGYLCFRLIIRVIDTPEKLRALCLWWLFGIVVLTVVGTLAGSGLFRPEWTYNDFSGRLSATMKFANQIPSYLGPALFVLVYLVAYPRMSRRYQLAALALVGGGVFVMLGTGSRTSFAITAFSIIFAVAAVLSARGGTARKGAITAAVVAGCFVFVSFVAAVWQDGTADYSLGETSPFERPIRMLSEAFQEPDKGTEFVQSRVSTIAKGLGELHNHPFFGTGSGMFTYTYKTHEIHNTFVSILVENGMFAFMVFLLWWFAMGLMLVGRSLYGPSAHARYVARLALGAFIALSLYQLTMNGMRQRPFWFVPAVAVVSTVIVRRSDAAKARATPRKPPATRAAHATSTPLTREFAYHEPA